MARVKKVFGEVGLTKKEKRVKIEPLKIKKYRVFGTLGIDRWKLCGCPFCMGHPVGEEKFAVDDVIFSVSPETARIIEMALLANRYSCSSTELNINNLVVEEVE